MAYTLRCTQRKQLHSLLSHDVITLEALKICQQPFDIAGLCLNFENVEKVFKLSRSSPFRLSQDKLVRASELRGRRRILRPVFSRFTKEWINYSHWMQPVRSHSITLLSFIYLQVINNIALVFSLFDYTTTHTTLCILIVWPYVSWPDLVLWWQ